MANDMDTGGVMQDVSEVCGSIGVNIMEKNQMLLSREMEKLVREKQDQTKEIERLRRLLQLQQGNQPSDLSRQNTLSSAAGDSTSSDGNDSYTKALYTKVEGTGDDAGHMYEVKMILLVFIRSMALGIPFRLASNMKGAGKFDDIVLFSDESVSLVQLKHRTTKDIKRYELLAFDGKFSVLTYFKSYRDEVEKEKFSTAQLIFYTNVDIERLPVPLDKQTDVFNSSSAGESFFFTQENYKEVYNLPTNIQMYKDFLENLGNEASEKGRNGSSGFISTYILQFKQFCLLKKIESVKINPSVKLIENLLTEVKKLVGISLYHEFSDKFKVYCSQANEKQLEIFLTDLHREVRKQTEINNPNFIELHWEKFKTLQELLPFSQKLESLDGTKKNPSEDKWKKTDELLLEVKKLGDFSLYHEFLKKFKVYCHQANETELDEVIKMELVKYIGVSEVGEEFAKLVEIFRVWWKNPNPYYLVENDPIWTDTIVQLFRKLSTYKLKELSDMDIEVKEMEVDKVRDKLRSSSLFHIIVDGDCTALALCKVYQALRQHEDTPIFVNSSSAINNKDFILGAWRSCRGKFLVLEADRYTEGLETLLSEVVQILRDQPEKKLVLITNQNCPKTARLVIQFETIRPTGFSKWTESISLVDLTETTQKWLLQMNVKFQGYEVLIGDLVGQYDALSQINEYQELKKVVKDELLMKLARKEPVMLGTNLAETPHYYVTRSMSRSDGTCIETGEWVNLQEPLVVVTGEPGIGKSTLITHLARSMKQNIPNLWVVRINLNECTQILEKITKSLKQKETGVIDDDFKILDEFMKYVAESNCVLEHPMEKCLFEHCLKISRKMILLFDGYDEICPHYEDAVRCILRGLQLREIKILVASRALFRNKIEDVVKLKSFSLDPFSREDQITFLKKVWNVKVKGVDPEILYRYVLKIVDHTACVMNDLRNTFMGIPLQTMFIAEEYEDKLTAIATSDCEVNLHMDKLELYDRFFQRKCEVYFEEKMGNVLTKTSTKETLEKFRDEADTLYQKCALLTLVSEADLKLECNKSIASVLKTSQEISERVDQVGLIKNVDKNGKPQFTHRTFAEYFMAKWLAEHHESNTDFIAGKLQDQSYQVVLDMFNRILSRNCKLHLSVINKQMANFKGLLASRGVEVNAKDSGGRTALHLSVLDVPMGGDECNFTQLLLAHHLTDVTVKDKILKWTALRYADAFCSWRAVDLLLQNNQHDLSDLVHTSSNIASPKYISNALGTACEQGYVALLTYLINKEIDVNQSLDAEGNRPVHAAVRLTAKDGTKAETILNLLLKQGADINSQNLDGKTPLHLCAENGNLKVVRYLVERKLDDNTNGTERLFNVLKGQKDLVMLQKTMTQYYDTLERTAQKLASSLEVAKYLEGCPAVDAFLRDGNRRNTRPNILESTVRFLVENLGAEVHSTDKMGKTPLHLASKIGNKDVVKYLLEKGAKVEFQDRDSYTPLHAAASQGHVEVAKCLVHHGATTHLVDQNGDAAQHLAAYWGRLGMVKYLLEEAGDEADSKGANERTVLHISAQNGHVDIMKYLLEEKGCSNMVDLRDKDGNTSLYLAGLDNKMNAVIYLTETVQDKIDIECCNGRTVLHAACSSGHINIVKYLIDKGSDLNTRDKDNNTALHLAAWFGKYDIIRFLVDQCNVSVSTTGKKGGTALHFAAEEGHLAVVKFLVEKGADMNAQDNDGNTPLYFANHCNRLEVVRYFVNKCGTDPNTLCEDGTISTDIADQQQHSNTNFLQRVEKNVSKISSDIVTALHNTRGVEKEISKAFTSKGLKSIGKKFKF